MRQFFHLTKTGHFHLLGAAIFTHISTEMIQNLLSPSEIKTNVRSRCLCLLSCHQHTSCEASARLRRSASSRPARSGSPQLSAAGWSKTLRQTGRITPWFFFFGFYQELPTPTSLPGGSPAHDVALCRLQEAVHRRGEAQRLDGVGHGCLHRQLQEGHVLVHVGAVEAWVDDDPLDGDNHSPNARAQHRPQAHGPVGRAGIAGVRNSH